MKKWRWTVVLCLALLLGGCAGGGSTTYYEEAIACMEKKDYEAAVALLTEAVEAEERLPESYRALGICQYELGDDAAAIAAFSRSLNALENRNIAFEKDVMYYLAEARRAYGEYEEAAEVYTEMLKLEEDPETYFCRGSIYLDLDRAEEAAQDFDSALKDSRDYAMYLRIYQVYEERGETVQAEEYLNRALELEPERAEDYYFRGQSYYEMKDYENAQAELIQAINEGSSEAALLLGKVYLAVDDVASARGMYQEYLKGEKSQAKAYNGLALCDISEQRYEEALVNIRKGLECKDKEEEEQSLLFNEIVVYEYQLDFETAKDKMAAYLERYPEDEAALRENEFLKSR